MVEIEPRALCILSKCCVAELYLALGSGFALCVGAVLCCGLLAEHLLMCSGFVLLRRWFSLVLGASTFTKKALEEDRVLVDFAWAL